MSDKKLFKMMASQNCYLPLTEVTVALSMYTNLSLQTGSRFMRSIGGAILGSENRYGRAHFVLTQKSALPDLLSEPDVSSSLMPRSRKPKR